MDLKAHSPVIKSQGIFERESDTTRTRLQSLTMGDPPTKLMLSLIGICNLDCYHCAGPQRDSTGLDLATLEWIFSEIIPNLRALRLGGNDNTEQLLSPKFLYFMDRMAKFPPLEHFEMVTNLSVMDRGKAERIAGQITKIEISLEGVDDRFETIRGFPWDTFTTHLTMLNERRVAASDSRLKIVLLFCSMLSTLEDALQIQRFKRLGVDKVVLRDFRPQDKPGHADDDLERDPQRVAEFIANFKAACHAHNMDYAITFESKFSGAPVVWVSDNQHPSKAAAVCHQPWEVISISHKGQLSACCQFPFWDSGNLPAQTLDEAWNSSHYQNLRRTVNSDAPPRVCQRCEFKRA